MVRNFAIARHVLETRHLIGKAEAEQVVGLHALKRGRYLLATAEPDDRECPCRVPSPARLKHRGVKQGLHQHIANVLGAQEPEDIFQREAMRRPERQNDRVFGGGGLELDIEASAEALAE